MPPPPPPKKRKKDEALMYKLSEVTDRYLTSRFTTRCSAVYHKQMYKYCNI